jgi:hypothetical protein
VINDVFLKRDDVSQSSLIEGRRAKPLRWEMTEKRPRVLENIFDYFIAMIVRVLENIFNYFIAMIVYYILIYMIDFDWIKLVMW